MKLKSWGLLFFFWLGLVCPSYAASNPADPKVLHLLNRLSFGPRPGEIERVESIGVERYIQEQLGSNSIFDSLQITNQLATLETLHQSPTAIFKQYNALQIQESNLNQREIQILRDQMSRLVIQQAVQARLIHAIQSRQQLQELMVDFWYNHFNVFSDKGLDRFWVGDYEEVAIRPYTLGRFRNLLEATARHPAMLFYLDNWQNRAAKGKSQGLNENYARELMELHTLGVDGGYTQQDVIALAKIFTGWGFCHPTQKSDSDYSFCFNAKQHDFSDKVFLGTLIKGSGISEGEQALDILARSPATARHISYQLAQYFVADQPPPYLVNHLAERFLSSDGDIRAVLDTLFHSPEFWDQKYYNAKFKTPYQYMISAIRAADLPVTNFTPLLSLLQQLGMPLYGCATPDGYKNTQDAWLNPDAMTRRLSFATVLASGQLPLTTVPANKNKLFGLWSNIDALLLSAVVGNTFSAQTTTVLSTSSPQLRPALILGSPEFMRR